MTTTRSSYLISETDFQLTVAIKCTVVLRNVRSFESSYKNWLLTPVRISKTKLRRREEIKQFVGELGSEKL